MNKCFLRTLVAVGFLPLAGNFCAAENWSQYRGDKGDGISSERLSRSWSAEGPKQLWKANTPAGFSSLAVVDGKVFTVVAREVNGSLGEVCTALDTQTGKEIWAAVTGQAKYRGGGDSGAEGNKGGDGPRSTPSVSGNRVYVYSAQMALTCLDAATGKTVWKKDILQEFGGKNIGWESAMSPVIGGNLVYVAGGGPGQSMLAFDKGTGAVVWKTGDEQMTHATPVVATIEGTGQVIFMMQSGLVSLEAGTGKPLWRFPFTYRTATGCSPVVFGNMVFCTAGYEVGGAACQVTRSGDSFQAKELWHIKGNTAVADLWSTPVCKDGYLYGMMSFKKFSTGPLKCVELKTGAVKWEQPGFGAGNVVLAGNDLVALSDDGQVVLVEANPVAYKELARAKVLNGKCWSTPALSNGQLYVRSTKESACVDLGSGK